MSTIPKLIKASDKVKEESGKLYYSFLASDEPLDSIDRYVRTHGSAEFIEWWDASNKQKQELRKQGIIIN